jgi:preprotein translocase subunit SecY
MLFWDASMFLIYLLGYKLDITGIDPAKYKQISSSPEGSIGSEVPGGS